LAAPFSKERL